MDSLINSTNMNYMALELMAGWGPVFNAHGYADGNSNYDTGSMSDTPITQNPKMLFKRRRLSRLLDRLTVQLRNNNQYPATPWHMPGSPPNLPKELDEPLDLSVKPEHPPPTKEPEPEHVCTTCGQSFAIKSRLAKHVASRHKKTSVEPTRTYECEICLRKFGRSDMLTRHARLHSGVKPYSCSACGQEFSRSDHLATHQRTHTGEKPYRCPACPYAACRRDMITRHLKTHSRQAQPV